MLDFRVTDSFKVFIFMSIFVILGWQINTIFLLGVIKHSASYNGRRTMMGERERE